MVRAILDADYVKHSAANAGEAKSIHVVHNVSGDELLLKNRTAFYGVGKGRDGGVLAEINKGRESPLLAEEYTIHDVQTPEPLANVLQIAKTMFEKTLRMAKADTHIAYLGKGDSQRVEQSTIIKYKGNRDNLVKPIHIEAVHEYLVKHAGCEVIEGIEADDQCVIMGYNTKNTVLLGVDKDYYGSPVNFLNCNKPQEGISNGAQFGALYRDPKGKVRGYGRMFMYHQICFADKIDNYAANSGCPKTPWGEVSSYNMLKDCTTDKEAFAAMKAVYQKLYPAPLTVVGWRGEPIEITWDYMLAENFQMARMLRWEGDVVSVPDLLTKMGLL